MIAILGWADGFGNDTFVKAIYPTLKQAKQHYSAGDRWTEFDYGLVDFDWYEANEFKEKLKMPVKKNAPCDLDGFCPYSSKNYCNCEYWCGETEE